MMRVSYSLPSNPLDDQFFQLAVHCHVVCVFTVANWFNCMYMSQRRAGMSARLTGYGLVQLSSTIWLHLAGFDLNLASLGCTRLRKMQAQDTVLEFSPDVLSINTLTQPELPEH